MTKPAIYLCGPINGCTDEECKSWRSLVTSIWPGRIIDPMRRDYRGREAESVTDIVELDKIDVCAAEALIVSYDKPSVGTSMEVLYAFERGKLVIVVTSPGVNISPWLRYHSHRIVYSYLDAVACVSELLEAA